MTLKKRVKVDSHITFYCTVVRRFFGNYMEGMELTDSVLIDIAYSVLHGAQQELLACFLCDLDCRIMHVNDYAYKLLGRPLIGKSIPNDLIAPTYRDWWDKQHPRRTITQGVLELYGVGIQALSGDILSTLVNIHPIYNRDTFEHYMYFIVIIDITQRRMREIQLVEASIAKAEMGVPDIAFTAAEQGILRCAHLGMSIKMTAAHLHIAARTVQNHRHHIRKKVGAPSRMMFVQIAEQFHSYF